MNVQLYSTSHGEIEPKRSGTQHPQVCPTGVFRGKQGYLVIMAFLDHHWAELCRIMGRPELAQDARYATNAARLERRDEVVKLIEGWLSSTESDEAATRALQDGHIPVAPVLSIAQAVAHLRQRGTVRTITDRLFGEFEAPILGEHNGEVLSRHLGYSPERIRALETEGVLMRGDR